MAPVQLSNITKQYGALSVIHGVSVDIPDGEFVTLVGPSGCGKSTLLRMLAGLETISGGQIRIGSKVVNDVPPKERDIAMVFQNYALYPHMTVAANMGFSLRLSGASKQEISEKVADAAKILNLTKLLERYPRQLSGGQRQRVAMGRAIVRNPQVFLFDEPLSNLDAALRVQMRAEIKALHERLKTTTVYVTHDQVEAMTMADKIVVMNGGNVEQFGAPLELYDKPRNRFVAGFIGSPAMNFFEGKVLNGGFILDNGISVKTVNPPSNTEGKRLTLGVRPEHFSIREGGLPVEIGVVEPTGSETHILGEIGSQKLVAVFRERLALKPGDSVSVVFDAASAHFFDPENGARVD